jgi:sugar/nucleoside kinase (ribokinase family)
VRDSGGGGPAPRGVFVGLATLDVVHRVPAPPRADEKVVAADTLLLAGGPAANAAVAFAAVGGSATLVTGLGSHPLARSVTGDLADHGVACVDTTPEHADPPPLSSVLVTAATGERAVVSDHGRRHDVPWVDLAPVLRGADVLLVDGHHPRLARAAVDASVRLGVPVVVDAGSWKQVFAEILPRADLVLCSADLRLPGVPDDATLDALLARGATAAGRSRGAAPLLWAAGAERGEVRVPRVEVVDTLGAGDVLHGAAAYAVARRGVSAAALRRWLPWAVRIASLSCTAPGTRAWLRTGQRLPPLPG